MGKIPKVEVLEASVGGLALQQKALSQGGRQSPSCAGLGRESLLANHPGSDATGGLECDLNTKGRLCALGVPSPSFPVIVESRVPAEPAIWAARVLFPWGTGRPVEKSPSATSPSCSSRWHSEPWPFPAPLQRAAPGGRLACSHSLHPEAAGVRSAFL